MLKILILFVLMVQSCRIEAQSWQTEKLSRGMVGIPVEGGVYLSWRMLQGDAPGKAFDIYRSENGGEAVKANSGPIVRTSDFTDTAADSSKDNEWTLVADGKTLARFSRKAGMPVHPYLSVPISRPEGGTVAGEKFVYRANDACVGDLDGDGNYEIVLKWEPSNSKRPPQKGFTGNTIIDAYRMDGTRLWRIDLGRNVRSGACTTNLLVFDFDGDGRAELCCKTGDGTIDGQGRPIGNPDADWRTHDKESPTYGKIVSGPEYLTVFDGLTGRALDTRRYVPTRYPVDGWGGIGGNCRNDTTGGRSDRYSAAVAFLDGKTPAAVMVRGWYGRTVLAAWTFGGGKLRELWCFDSAQPEWQGYSGMGNHNLTVADLDGDGCDEICVGAMTVDHNGRGLYTTGLRHGDAMHVGDLIPARPGLEVFGVHENEGNNKINAQTPAAAMFDGRTGTIIWQDGLGKDAGRCVAADIDPRFPGAECWSSLPGLRRADNGKVVAAHKPNSCNFTVYWDADPLSELLDGVKVSKWNYTTETTDLLFEAEGVVANNGSKANPCISGDILGDWREEIVWASRNQDELRIYVTNIPATCRRPTLLADRQYRLSLVWQNVAYNQPPHTSYDMATATRPALSVSGLDKGNFDKYWTVESESPDYRISFSGDTCRILSPKGLTLWRNNKMEGNVTIEYDACVVDNGKPGDRLSDLNCFWMASDPEHPDNIFARAAWRNANFPKCYSMQLYYVGYGGNHNSTTRFRRYNADTTAIRNKAARPAILREYRDSAHLLTANKWYHIKIQNKDGRVIYSINGETLVDYVDPAPLTSGWFGFRTTLSHTCITNFRVNTD